MTLEPVMLAITEDALADLATTYARHNTMNHRTAGQSWHGHRDMDTGNTTAADRAACWLRLVSITEIHAENFLRHLDDGTQDKPPSRWDQIKNGLKIRHGIEVDLLDSAAELEECFLVRNAIAHGLGRFTDNQLRKMSEKPGDLTRRLRSIGVSLRDGAVVITPAALTGCRDTCRVFVAALDSRRPQPSVGGLPPLTTTPSMDAPTGPWHSGTRGYGPVRGTYGSAS